MRRQFKSDLSNPNPAKGSNSYACKIRLLIEICCALIALICSPALADYPDKPIKIIVPYPPGGTTDLLIRLVAPKLSERLQQPFVIENKAGAGGVLGSQIAAKSPPDGYTLVFASVASHAIIPAIQRPPPYDPLKDFTPLSLLAITPNVFIVNANSPIKSMEDLIALAKNKPGQLSFGSTSLGGSPHMSGELLKNMAKINLLHVPYKGGSPMMMDLLGGQVSLGVDNLPSSIQYIRSGKIRALAVTTSKRWPTAQDTPTMSESGVPGYESSAWFGLFAPANTPKHVIDVLQKNIQELFKSAEIERLYLDQGAIAVGNSPEEFSKFIDSEMKKWSKVVNENGLKIDQ
jgi:tripartite-type tricarboxylate transporter receptor subunit TctC